MVTRPLIRLLVITLSALTLGLPHVTAAADNSRQPQPVDHTPFVLEGFCAFPLEITLSGKTKTIDLPGGRTLVTAPGQTATIRNLDDPENEVTLNITGAFHTTVLSNGDVVTKATGRNILLDPIAGIVLTQGNFTFAFDAEGNLIQPLSGQGQMTNICELVD